MARSYATWAPLGPIGLNRDPFWLNWEPIWAGFASDLAQKRRSKMLLLNTLDAHESSRSVPLAWD